MLTWRDRNEGSMIRKILVCGLVPVVLALTAAGCKQQKMTDAEKAEAMITAKTLGLAYLEENKLEQAREEFMKIIELDDSEVMGYANLGIVFLRMGEYGKAEEWLKKAIKIAPEDPDVRLILAKVYEMSNRPQEAVETLETNLELDPGHVKTLFSLSEIYGSMPGEEALEKRLEYTRALAENAPANVVPRLNLIEVLIAEGESGQALEEMEKLPQVFPEFPEEAGGHYQEALLALRKGDAGAASTPYMVFHNYLKVTTPYQAGMMDLKGPGGSLVGSPVVTFNQTPLGFESQDWETILAAIRFTDITSTAGLDFLLREEGASGTGEPGRTHLSAADYDQDGDTDLYAGQADPATGRYHHYLLKNDWGVYENVAPEAGVDHTETEAAAGFVDWDNDGWLDLHIVAEGSNRLYRNNKEGGFEDVTSSSGAGEPAGGNGSLFLDYDHDGDLDIYVTRQGENRLFRNNADGTFTEEAAAAGLGGGTVEASGARFGDFDEDGDLDLLVVSPDGPPALYSNQRQGIFREITEDAGLSHIQGARSVAVGDYNNDGFLDLFFASTEPGGSGLYLNRGDGSFAPDDISEDVSRTLGGVRAMDGAFFDFDNDGFLDLMVVGEAAGEGGSGVFLYHNDGNGKQWLAPDNLPADLTSGREITLFDYNDDGDLDVAVTGLDGGVRLFRNDGGNNHNYIKMKLVGLKAGSAKNNYYGIGARVEVRAGSLYQSAVVTGPDIHFGLGPRSQAEVIRIIWTNGVPQNMFFPATNQDLIEEQQLKGSCPFLYTWNGEEFVFQKDIMWKSALGMPLGIMGEGTAYAPAGASADYVKIPGDQLVPRDGKLVMQVTGELWETMYMDQFELIVLDHPAGVEVYVDERMGPPSVEGYRLYQVSERIPPVSAVNQYGEDLLPWLLERDDRYHPGSQPGKYQGVTEASELVLDPGKIDPEMLEGEKPFRLFLYGWIFPTDASINASISQSDQVKTFPPVVEVMGDGGEWEVAVGNLGFPMGKDKMLVADLTGKIHPGDPRVRIRTNMDIHWDQVFFSTGDPGAEVRPVRLKPVAADLHYRGFSRTYRKGGRHGPHWFDYSKVSTAPKWRDLTGYYTRYGDVLPLVTESDSRYIIKNAGDETTLEFDASGLPELPAGWTRDYLIYSVGWVKDGDLNTAHGQTVEPLPFHGMSAYPYGPGDNYPESEELREYRREYNTRKVGTEGFVRELIDPGYSAGGAP